MNRSTSMVEERLADYRPTLDDAIAGRTSAIDTERASVVDNLVEFDWDVEVEWDSTPEDHAPNRSRLLVAAVVVVLIGGLGVLFAVRSDLSVVGPANSPESVDTATTNRANVTADDGDTPPADTAPATIVLGSGLTPACPAQTGTETIGIGTLYLGGPPSDQNLAASGFIFSLPKGPALVDVAIKAIALPVIGLECSITGAPTEDENVVSVSVEPPAVPVPLQLDVTISETNDSIGVTRIDGSTSFEITNSEELTSVRLLDGVPSSAERMQVRFKKGEDVWELSADPTVGADVPLTVPNGEVDNYPSEPVDWVLFTLIGANERIVGTGGRVI